MRVREELEGLRAGQDEILDTLRGRKPCKWGVCHPEADCTCGVLHEVDVDYRTTKPASATQFVPAFSALRNALVHLPQTFYERRGKRVVIACRCRRALDVPEYAFMECGCGRLFCATHRSVKVLPLDG